MWERGEGEVGAGAPSLGPVRGEEHLGGAERGRDGGQRAL